MWNGNRLVVNAACYQCVYCIICRCGQWHRAITTVLYIFMVHSDGRQWRCWWQQQPRKRRHQNKNEIWRVHQSLTKESEGFTQHKSCNSFDIQSICMRCCPNALVKRATIQSHLIDTANTHREKDTHTRTFGASAQLIHFISPECRITLVNTFLFAIRSIMSCKSKPNVIAIQQRNRAGFRALQKRDNWTNVAAAFKSFD